MRERATDIEITAVLAALQELWRSDPEQRLGQLLLNLTRDEHGQVSEHRLWNADEATLMLAIEARARRTS